MLTVITGPMFSGKTNMLISMATSHQIAGHTIQVFKPAKDDRYSVDKIVSHSDRELL